MIEVLTVSTLDGFQDKFLTNSEVIFVVASGAATSVDFSLIDGVEGTNSASSLEGELVGSTRESTNSTTIQGISSGTDTLSIGDDLVGSTSVTVSI